jgi:hypothetical protein
MTNNRFLTLVGVLGVAVIGLGMVVLRDPAAVEPDPALYVDRERYDDLEESHRKLTSLARKAQARANKLSARTKALEAQAAQLSAALESQRALAEAEEKEKLAAAVSTLPVAFGKWAELDAIKNADWPEMGEAVEIMNALVLELYEIIEKGETPDSGLQEKIRAENNKLVRYAAQIMGKIPTHSPINGEFSHPITLTNLMGAMLERGDTPLTEEQTRAMAQLGNEYEAHYDLLGSSYDESTPRLEKLVDELELKRDTMWSMENVLTDAQRDAVIQPAIHDLQLNPLSPATMTTMLAKPKKVKSLEELRGRLPGYLSDWFGVSEEHTAALGGIADAWIEDMKPYLAPSAKPDKFLHLDQTIAAGRAQVNAMKQLLLLPELDEKARKAILNHLAWRVPQVVETSPE